MDAEVSINDGSMPYLLSIVLRRCQVTTAKELLLGKAHQKLQNRIKAKESYQAALMIDSTCSEVSSPTTYSHSVTNPAPTRHLMHWLTTIC